MLQLHDLGGGRHFCHRSSIRSLEFLEQAVPPNGIDYESGSAVNAVGHEGFGEPSWRFVPK
jgi:hypothetical protein